MGAKKNISQIDKYLRGQLNAKAMHQLERQAQDDPFLMDALEGFEKAGASQQANLADLEARLANRVAKNKTRSILLWRVLPAAACLLLMLGGGYWFISRPANKVQYADHIRVESKPKPTETEAAPVLKETRENVAQNEAPKKASIPLVPKKNKVEYTARTIPVKENTTVDELVKKMSSLEVDSTGNVIKQGDHAITSVKLNGKDFTGGNVSEALKKLPPDILEKVQIIDNEGYASKKSNVEYYGSKPPVVALKPSYKSGSFGSLANPPLVGPAPLPAGKVIISGTILDAKTKEALTGTDIIVNGARMTQADINGKYQAIVDTGATIEYKFPYYLQQSIKLQSGQTIANANLNTDPKSLNDVVIRGYVKRDRNVSTGSSYIITGKEVQDNPVGNVEQLLQGKVAGLNIQNNTGAPGMRNIFNKRGLPTVTTGKEVQNYPVANVDQLLQGKVTGLNIQNNTGAPGMRGFVNIRGLSTLPAATDTSLNLRSQMYWVKGIVTDNTTNETIAAATLSQGGGVTQQTKSDGTFEYLNIGPSLLTITKPGYLPAQVKIDSAVQLKIALKRKNISPTAPDSFHCKENLAFKRRFFENIAIVEKYTERQLHNNKAVTNKQFLSALQFIARYTLVSVRTDLKDLPVYYNRRSFIEEKQRWLNWYEANKCRGLK